MNQHLARILCVDDAPLNLSTLDALLSPRGYEVVSAGSGRQALEKIATERIDLCLLEGGMAGMDGFELCRRIKADDARRHIPVVMFTSGPTGDHRLRGIEAGAENFISKPFDDAEVLARIKMLLEIKSLEDRRKVLEAELQRAHDRLESMVHERSVALTGANRRLTMEIVERKKAEESLRGSYAEIKRLQDRLSAENVYLRQEAGRRYDLSGIVGHSAPLAEVFLRVEQVASLNATVLLLGETGTGKGALARALHERSARNAGQVTGARDFQSGVCAVGAAGA